MLTDLLIWLARHGRACLVAGLLAGLLLPETALAMRPWLPELVAVLLFITALRIGPRAALGGLRDLRRTVGLVLALQLAMPLAALALLWPLGLTAAPLALAVVLMLCAPSVTGSPNFTILLGHDPAPAMRLLIVGTAIFPLTALVVLWLLPGLGDPAAVFAAAGRLLAVIAGAVALGFGLRHFAVPDLARRQTQALDGMAALALAVVVVGLMSALGPALRDEPWRAAGWLAAVMAVNLGLQIASRRLLGPRPDSPAISIIAGNRNIALFLVALPPEVTDPLLLFIGCYQVPMYLTPILMRPIYGQGTGD